MPRCQKTKGLGADGASRRTGIQPRWRHRPNLSNALAPTGEHVVLKSHEAGLRRLAGRGVPRPASRPPAGPAGRLDPDIVMYHGSAGAFAHIACRTAFPQARSIACASLLDVIDAVRAGKADAAVLPCENLLAGRVPDIHLLLPEIGLSIVGEIFLPIELHLVAPEGWSLEEVRRVHSHPVALRQVRRFLSARGLTPVEQGNTATAAALLRQTGDRADAAVASELAAQTYGLTILQRNIEDNPFNMTRFYVLACEPVVPAPQEQDILTCVLFEVRNTPGALFHAVGGFAHGGINLTRLESYLVDGQFVATRFLCEFEGHPYHPHVGRALDTLKRHSTSYAILGTFPMHDTGARRRADTESTTCGADPQAHALDESGRRGV